MKKFDPSADCVVLDSKRKKKAAIKRKPERFVTISVVMMKKFIPSIPKGKQRQRLASQGRMQGLKVTHSMNGQEIRNKIMDAFKVSKFTILETDKTGHILLKSCDQEIDGGMVIQRRGCLYLCEIFDVCSLNQV